MRAFEISFVILKGQGPFVWSSSFPCHQKLGWMFCRRALDRGLHLELVPRRCATAVRFFFYSGLQHPSQFFQIIATIQLLRNAFCQSASNPHLYTPISFSPFLFNPEVKNTKVHQEMNTPECSNLFDSPK